MFRRRKGLKAGLEVRLQLRRIDAPALEERGHGAFGGNQQSRQQMVRFDGRMAELSGAGEGLFERLTGGVRQPVEVHGVGAIGPCRFKGTTRSSRRWPTSASSSPASGCGIR